MKNALILIASAAFLLAGCAKVQVDGTDADMVSVTFAAVLVPEGTRAAIDEDGEAAEVNHWVLEVRDAQNELFYEVERDVAAGTLQQVYDLKLFKNQSYTLQFWADTKDTYDTSDLTAVSIVGTGGWAANLDSRDAFSANVEYESGMASESKNVTLRRPFGQLNIITTDLADLKAEVEESAYDKYAPNSLQVEVKVPTTFNVQTQTAGDASETLCLTADQIYGNWSNPGAETTLFMDYIFATADDADVLEIGFSFISNQQEISYGFNNIPLQRNYRTNIKGQLMSNDSEWTVVIDPLWNTPEYDEDL